MVKCKIIDTDNLVIIINIDIDIKFPVIKTQAVSNESTMGGIVKTCKQLRFCCSSFDWGRPLHYQPAANIFT